MKFLKINIHPASMIDDFFVKYSFKELLSYDILMSKYFDEYYWPSNSLEKSLKSLYNWECNTLVSLMHSDKKQKDFFFDKWSEKYNQQYIADDFYDKLLFQITHHKPDILYIQEIWQYPSDFISKIRYILGNIIIVGWNCSLNSKYCLNRLRYISVIYTCSDEIQQQMQMLGIYTKNIGHGFDKDILNNLLNIEKKYNVVFVGSLIGLYNIKRVELLKYLINKGIKVTIFGRSNDVVLQKYCKKPVFGLELFKIYKSSKIVLNSHASQDIRYSGNVRMFEVTGVGSLLISDYKEDIEKIFDINKEIVLYSSNEEAFQKIKYYLVHDEERKQIAKQGQSKTLGNYLYKNIAKKVYKYIDKSRSFNEKRLYLNTIPKKQNNNNYIFSVEINNFFKKLKQSGILDSEFILYGYGEIGRIIYERYKTKVKYIVDNNFEKINLDNVIEPKKINLLNTKLDIFISVFGREDEIKTMLLSHGIDKKRIKVIDI